MGTQSSRYSKPEEAKADRIKRRTTCTLKYRMPLGYGHTLFQQAWGLLHPRSCFGQHGVRGTSARKTLVHATMIDRVAKRPVVQEISTRPRKVMRDVIGLKNSMPPLQSLKQQMRIE